MKKLFGLVIIVVIFSGCSYYRAGKFKVKGGSIPIHIGDTRVEVIARNGQPDTHRFIDSEEIMIYRVGSGGFLLLGGLSTEHDVVAILKNGQVEEVKVEEAGKSVGILSFPLAGPR